MRRYMLLTVAFFLLLGQLNLAPFRALAEENGNEDLSYEVQKELSNDKKKATLKIKVTPKDEKVTILAVKSPDGKKTEGQEATYTAGKNGKVEFLITYQNMTDEKVNPVVKTYSASYEVSELISDEEANKESETKSATDQANTYSQPNSDTKDNKKLLKSGQTNVTLSIPEYNQIAWSNGDIKTVTTIVEFGESTTSGKKWILLYQMECVLFHFLYQITTKLLVMWIPMF